MYATIPPSSTNEQGASTCTRGRRRVSSSDTRLSSPAQDTTIQPLPAGSVNRIGRAWCSAMQAGCRWWNDAECLGSCEMARVQLGKPLPAVGCD